MRLARLIDGIPLALGAWIAALVFTAWAGRLLYPYDLEWMEGGMLAHAWRLQQGLPLYQPPDATWIPFIYPPGYPAVVAALGAGGLAPWIGRAVSIVGTLLACGALVFAGWRQGSRAAGLLGAAVFLACYPDSGAFYDLVRPDALGIGLAGWALVLGLEASPRARLGAALLLAAAFAVKHNLAVFGLPMALGIGAGWGWREGLRFGLAAALPALGLTIALELGSGAAPGALLLPASALVLGAGIGAWRGAQAGLRAAALALLPTLGAAAWWLGGSGHFQRTLLGIPRAHPWVHERLVPGAVEELGDHLGLALVGCTLVLVAGTARREGRGVWGAAALGALLGCGGVALPVASGVPPVSLPAELAAWASAGAAVGTALAGLGSMLWRRRVDGRWVYGVGVALTAAVAAGLMRAHHGGFLNVYIPLHWVVGLGVVGALTASRRAWPTPAVGALGALAVAAQLGLKLDLSPARFTPGPEDRAAGDAFVAALQDCDGPIFSPFAAWLPVYAGQAPSVHLIALWDINHRDSPYRSAVRRVEEAAAAQSWACVVDGSGRPLGYGIQRNYEVAIAPPVPRRPTANHPQTFMPRTGWRVRPRAVLVPKETR